jgi:hypothetical protein
MKRIRIIILGLIAVAVVLAVGYQAFKWTVMRVYVGPNQALVVINKLGHPLPEGRVTADDTTFKGVQREVRGPGRYFLNPLFYDTQIVPLTVIPAGDPTKWDFDANGNLKDPKTAPMIGLVALKEGPAPSQRAEVVKPGERGIQPHVLTPGVYKLNPHRYEVSVMPAVIVPPGSVGVVTRLVGDIGQVSSAPLIAASDGATTWPGLVVGSTSRGVLRDVLQPGIYFLNPKMVKVTIAPVGYDAITLEAPRNPVNFFSSDGYLVEADFTVVWGRTPTDAPAIVASIGDTDQVEQKVIEPAMKAACQNHGATYSAMELIQGQTREKFQLELENSLRQQMASRNVHILLALVRNITIKDRSGKDATEGLLATIQRTNIEIERELTNKQKTETAQVRAKLEEALKLVDVARETVTAETGVKVANILAEGDKKAAEIGAQRELEVAKIALEAARLDAQRIQIAGKAAADVERLKNEAQARGAKMLVDALGSPAAYNSYVFARNFQPAELRFIVAGPGTFWTDLKTFQEVGAAKMAQPPPAGAGN